MPRACHWWSTPSKDEAVNKTATAGCPVPAARVHGDAEEHGQRANARAVGGAWRGWQTAAWAVVQAGSWGAASPIVPAQGHRGSRARCAHQAQRQAHGGGHAAHLAVAAFADGELQPGRGDALAKAHGRVALPTVRAAPGAGPGRAGWCRPECHALAQAAQLFFGRVALHCTQ